jgi:6,7-dimethyl-8-ribityllumazine synthase
MSRLREETGLAPDAAADLRFAVVVSRTNSAITGPLLDGALETLRAHGATAQRVRVYEVPGAYELPMAADRAARAGDVDAVVCIGALVRGETPHFEVLAHAVGIAVQDVARERGVPATFGVLTCDTWEQAEARCGGERGNKGSEAAVAAIEMARLFARIDERG